MVLFLLYPPALISSYALIGAGIKYLDHLTEYPIKLSKHNALPWLLTLTLAILVNIWTFLDAYTAIFAMAIIFGLLGAQKVDNIYFIVLALFTLPICVLTIIQQNLFVLLIPNFLLLIPSVTLDEVLHSAASKVNTSILHWFLSHRPILKIVVIILPFYGLFTFIHTIAFWGFDVTYDLMNYHLRASNTVEH